MPNYIQKASDATNPFRGLSGGDYLQAMIKSQLFEGLESMVFMGTNKGLMGLFKRDGGESLPGLNKTSAANGHGAEVQWNMQVEHSGSYAALTEDTDFAGPGRSKVVRAVAPMRAASGSISVTNWLEKQTGNKKYALVDALQMEHKSILQTLRANLRRKLLGDGGGVLGLVKAISGSGGVGSTRLITIEADPAVAVWPVPNDARFFFPGQLIAWSADGTTVTGFGKVNTAGNVAGKTTIADLVYNQITIELKYGTAPTAGMYLQPGARNNADSAYVASWRNEMLGLGAVLNGAFEENYDGTDQLHGLGTVAYPLWNPLGYDFTVDGNTQNISPALLLDAVEMYLHRNGDDAYPDFMASTHRLHLAYANYLAKDAQYAGSVDNKGGTSQTGNTFNGGFGVIPWTIDRLMPDGEVWMGKKNACQYIWWEKPGFVPLDGGNMWRQSDVSPKKLAVYTMYGNFITTKRWQMARFKGFTQAATWR